MAHKYDATKAKNRRIQFLVLLIAGAVGYGLTANLIIPTTSMEENLWAFSQIGFLLVSIIAVVGISANLLAKLTHDIEHPR